jgi:hypothetical protein
MECCKFSWLFIYAKKQEKLASKGRLSMDMLKSKILTEGIALSDSVLKYFFSSYSPLKKSTFFETNNVIKMEGQTNKEELPMLR